MKGAGGRGVAASEASPGPPHVQFVAPWGVEGRAALGAAGPQRKSCLVPSSPLPAPRHLGWGGMGGAGGRTGEVTAGLNAEGNDPSLALGRPPRGFPHRGYLLWTVQASHFPPWMWSGIQSCHRPFSSPGNRSHPSVQLSDCETEVRDGDSEYK